MHQISFNTNHDFAPSVLANGQIVFSRWESINGDQISLYRANPDGTGLELFYGANSHATGANIAGTNNNVIQFLNARQRADGKLLAIVRPFIGTQLGGDIVQIDAAGFVEINQPSTPAGARRHRAGERDHAWRHHRCRTCPPWAADLPRSTRLYDGTNRMLVSWSPCLVLDTTVTPNTTNVCTASNTTGANVHAGAAAVHDVDLRLRHRARLSPMLSAESGTDDRRAGHPAAAHSRAAVTPGCDAAPAPPAQARPWPTAVSGLLDISSVYDFDGVDTAAAEHRRRHVAIPVQTGFYARGRTASSESKKRSKSPTRRCARSTTRHLVRRAWACARFLGYAPVQPDGSVQIQVPANVPFTIDIVDANARRITAQHTSWLQVMPGETKTCNGCHTRRQQDPPRTAARA